MLGLWEMGFRSQQWVLFKPFSLEAILRKSRERSRRALCHGAEQLFEMNIEAFLRCTCPLKAKAAVQAAGLGPGLGQGVPGPVSKHLGSHGN